ncbi:MAG: hypothetical protein IJM74_00500 [Bacteroidales bacterium]|nr:hypothetical protein [Bacteroidales bacterium]
MKIISHIMVSLAVFLLLVFGAGGMGCQRCSCSGRVSILLLADGCCNRGSNCMDVKVSPVSVANIVQTVSPMVVAEMDAMSVCKHEPIILMPRMYDAVVGWQCRGVDSPPGWLSGNCAVLRV